MASGFSAIQNNSDVSQGLSPRLAAQWTTRAVGILMPLWSRREQIKVAGDPRFDWATPRPSSDMPARDCSEVQKSFDDLPSDRKRRSGTKKMPRGRLGQHRGKTLVSGARLVRPSPPQSHMLAYKDLMRRRDTETRLCRLCGVPSGPTRKSPAQGGA
jgi:hypothetical protein